MSQEPLSEQAPPGGAVERLTPQEREMVAANLGLCGWAVGKWGRHLASAGGPGYTQEDAYQDAVFGLVSAVRKFDGGAGFTFATYAGAWLHQAIQRGEARHEGVDYRRWAATRVGPPPSKPMPLDLPVGDEGALTLADTIGDEGPSVEDVVAATLAVADLQAMRSSVCSTEREGLVFDALFESEMPTLEELGRRIGQSRASAFNVKRRITHRLASSLQRAAS